MSNAPKTTRYRSFGSIRRKSANKFLPSYRHGGKVYYGKLCATKTDAANWLAGEQLLIAQGKWSRPGVPNPKNTETPTFGEFARRHIELQTTARGEHLRPKTRANYESYLRLGLRELEDVPINEITKPVVDRLWKELVSQGKKTSASHHYKFLKAVMARAIADGWLGENASNPCQVRGAQNLSTGRELRTPTPKEVLALAGSITPRFRLVVILCGFIGLRFGEVAALQRSDFKRFSSEEGDFFVVQVNKAVSYVNGDFILGPPKSAAGVRSLPVPQAITEQIDAHLGAMSEKSEDALVFTSGSGGFIRNDVMSNAMRRGALKAGLDPKGLSPHSLRRAAGTAYANVGANVAEVQALLGDASPDAALRYIQPTNRSHHLINKMGEDIVFENYIWN